MWVQIAGPAAFATVSLVVAVRLILVARRTGGSGERLLAVILLSSGFLAITTLVAAYLSTGVWVAHFGFVSALANAIGTGSILRFTRHHVGRTDPVGKSGEALVWGLCALALVGEWASGGFQTAASDGVFGIGGVLLRSSVFAWVAFETGRYASRLARQARFGLVEPAIVQRVRLWVLAACAAAAGFLADLGPLLGEAAVAPSLAGGGILGLLASLFLWLAFFPPSWARRWMTALHGA